MLATAGSGHAYKVISDYQAINLIPFTNLVIVPSGHWSSCRGCHPRSIGT